MRYVTRTTAIVLAMFALGVSAASAQHPQTRKGFWIGFGFGYGSYGISCSGCSGLGRESSFTGHIRLGGTVSPKLLLGMESVAWTKSQGGATITAGNLSLAADYYPQPASGLFLSAGLGFSRVETSSSGSPSTGSTGPGFTLGADLLGHRDKGFLDLVPLNESRHRPGEHGVVVVRIPVDFFQSLVQRVSFRIGNDMERLHEVHSR